MSTKANTVESWGRDSEGKKNEGEWTGKAEINTRTQFLAVMKHAWLYSDLLKALK